MCICMMQGEVIILNMVARKAFLENPILFHGFSFPTDEELFLRLITFSFLFFLYSIFATPFLHIRLSFNCEMIPITSICSHIVCYFFLTPSLPNLTSTGSPTSLYPSKSVMTRCYPLSVFCNQRE